MFYVVQNPSAVFADLDRRFRLRHREVIFSVLNNQKSNLLKEKLQIYLLVYYFYNLHAKLQFLLILPSLIINMALLFRFLLVLYYRRPRRIVCG